MHPLLKVVLTMLAGFAVLFFAIKLASGLSFADADVWLRDAGRISTGYLVTLVVGLLIIDLLVSVPTLTITMLAGYLLGQGVGAFAALVGLYSAGILGYGISRYFGTATLRFVIRDDKERLQAAEAFETHGFGMIILARAIPILPEVTACLAGATGMPLGRFLLAWSFNSVPYVMAATYAGSISSMDDPTPSLFTAIGIASALWIGWFLFRRHIVAKRRPT